MTSVKEALSWATKQLKKVSESPSLDADVLLEFVLAEPRAFLYGHPEAAVKSREDTHFRKLVARRKEGEPIAYLVGEKEFYGKSFLVNKHVLIPRPDTEHLVDAVLDVYNNQSVTVADIGTGSGAVSIALKSKAPRMHVIATDISKKALEVAKENAKRHGVEMMFLHGNLTEPLQSPVDGLVANLPYLTEKEAKNPTLAFEPNVALSGGGKGLDYFHQFFLKAPRALKKGGHIFLEIGAKQAKAVTEMAETAFPGAHVRVRQDLGGFDRVLTVELPDERPKKKKQSAKPSIFRHLTAAPRSLNKL